jgi:hypothetical protein
VDVFVLSDHEFERVLMLGIFSFSTLSFIKRFCSNSLVFVATTRQPINRSETTDSFVGYRVGRAFLPSQGMQIIGVSLWWQQSTTIESKIRSNFYSSL